MNTVVRMAVLGIAVTLAGCATLAGPTPEEAIADKMAIWKEAVVANDLETAMSVYSEDFEHYEYGDKAGYMAFLEQAQMQGFMDGVEVYTDEMEVVVEGDTATVYPVEVSGSFGTAVMEMVFTDEDGEWMVTTLDMSGV